MGAVRISSDDGEEMVIGNLGQIDVSLLPDFKTACEKVGEGDKRCIVDLSGVDSMTSEGLGMLLLLRAYAGDDKADIQIINCSPRVRAVISRACLSNLFRIEPQ